MLERLGVKKAKQLVKSKRMWVTGLLTSGWLLDTLQMLGGIRQSLNSVFGLQNSFSLIVVTISFGLMIWTKLHDDKQEDSND